MSSAQAVILMVEDEVNDAFLMQRAMQHAKVINPVQIVSDGHQAIAYLNGDGEFSDREQFPLPVLILLDLNLPGRNGLEVLSWLREQPTPVSRIPVVVLTVSQEAMNVNGAYDLGANSYLVKPVTPDGLIHIAKALEMYWLLMNEHPEMEPKNFQCTADHGTFSTRTVN